MEKNIPIVLLFSYENSQNVSSDACFSMDLVCLLNHHFRDGIFHRYQTLLLGALNGSKIIVEMPLLVIRVVLKIQQPTAGSIGVQNCSHGSVLLFFLLHPLCRFDNGMSQLVGHGMTDN
jgi:hypothetical protein